MNLEASNANNQSSGGFDVLRLVKPAIEDINEDFICGICKSKLL